MDEDYGRDDRDYWNTKYDVIAECYEHGEMYYDEDAEDWRCSDCEEIEVTYKYG